MNLSLRRSCRFWLHFLFVAIPTLALSALGQDGAARMGRFTRGTGDAPYLQSFVVPLSQQHGIPLALEGGVLTNLLPSLPWGYKYHYDATNSPSQSNSITGRIRYVNPIVAFGSRFGGTPLELGRPQAFGIHPGARYTEDDTNANATIRIYVYSRTNMSLLDTQFVPVPRIHNTNEWSSFVTNSLLELKAAARGMTTVVSRLEQVGNWASEYPRPTNSLTFDPYSNYRLVHCAGDEATNYLYLVSAFGATPNGEMSVTVTGAPPAAVGTDTRLYLLDFSPRPAHRPAMVHRPHFRAEPLPPEYLGKTTAELLSVAAAVTNAIPAGATNWLGLDDSPELRQHPALDRLVADLGSNAVALAGYVQNEIGLTDFMGYNDGGPLNEVSINPGGINRGALGVLLERQGSPVEQCALLVYLLRRAGVPAAFVFAPEGGVKLLDLRLSSLLQVQVAGAVDWRGAQYSTNSLIPVNYPWVAARVGTNWVHLFPWLKDYEVIEGLSLYEHMPGGYRSGAQWLHRYLTADTNILGLSAISDLPSILFPKFIQKSLDSAFPGLSVDDMGVRIRQRRFQLGRWEDFPKPTWVTNGPVVSARSITDLAGQPGYPSWTNAFDTLSLEIRSTASPAVVLKTGDLRTADLHNRRFLARHEAAGGGHNLIVSLAPLRPSATNSVGAFSNDAALINAQRLTAALPSSSDVWTVTAVHRRQRMVPATTQDNLYWASFPGFGMVLSQTNSSYFRAGDLAAFCLNLGRVTTEMVEVHAREHWEMERLLAETPALTNTLSPDLLQGLPALLTGASYLRGVSDFTELNERLHKSRSVSRFGFGLSLYSAARPGGSLPNGPPVLNQPSVDMVFGRVAIMGSGGLHLDSNDEADRYLSDMGALGIAESSAREHDIFGSFYGLAKSVSTVSLLRQAAQPGSAGIAILHRHNYGSYSYLSNYSPSIWKRITNSLSPATAEADFTRVYVTAGPVTNTTVGYTNIGALIMSPFSRAALIDAHGWPLNGGHGPKLPDDRLSSATARNRHLGTGTGGNLVMEWGSQGWTGGGPSFASETPTRSSIWQQFGQISSGASSFGLENSYESQFLLGASASGWGPSALSPAAGFQTAHDNGGGWFSTIGTWFSQLGSKVQDPVNAVTGEFYHDETDLALPGPMPLTIRRSYSSHNLDLGELRFGYGWRISYQPYLRLTGTNVILAAEMDGSVIAYRQVGTGTNCWRPTPADNPLLSNHTGGGVGSTANLFNNWITNRVESGHTNYYLHAANGHVRRYRVRSFPLPNGGGSFDRVRPYLEDWRDGQGNSYLFTYGEDPSLDDYGQPNRILSSNGNRLVFRYDAAGHIVEAFTGDGRRLRYEYDDHGDLVGVERPDASEVKYEYLPQVVWTNRISTGYPKSTPLPGYVLFIATNTVTTHVETPWGTNSSTTAAVSYSSNYYGGSGSFVHTNFHHFYTITNRMASSMDTSGSAARFSSHLLASEIKPDGRVLENQYDHLRRVRVQAATVGTDLRPVTNAWFYYTNDFTSLTNRFMSGFTRIVDVHGSTNVYHYTNNLITKITDALGGTETQDWFETGETNKTGYYHCSLEARTDMRGLRTEFQYDARGNITNQTVRGDLTGGGSTNETAVTSYTYRTNNLPETVLDPVNGKTVLGYADANYPYLPTTVTRFAGATPVSTNRFWYTNITEVVSVGAIVETNRAFGVRWRTVRGGSATNETAYDGRGWPVGEVRFTRSAEVPANTDPSVSSAYAYSPRGSLIEAWDAAGRRREFDHDALGRPKWEEVYESGAEQPLKWAYTYYNENGEVTWTDGPRYGPEDYAWKDYDGAGRVTTAVRWRSQARAGGTGVEEAAGDDLYSAAFSYYDGFGNLTNTVNTLGQRTVMRYDALGRMTNQVSYDAAGTALATNRFLYEPGGQVRVSVNPLGGATTNHFTSAGKPYRRQNPDGTTNGWTYYLDGRPRRESLPNGSYWETAYDDVNRRVTRTFRNAAGTFLASEVTEFDTRGNAVKVTDLTGAVFTKTYDGLDRVKTATGPAAAGGSAQQVTTYIYDAAGQTLTVADALGNKTSTTSDAAGRPTLVAVLQGATTNRVTRTLYSPDHHAVTTIEGTGAGAVTNTVFTDTFGQPVLELTGIPGQYRLRSYDRLGNLLTNRNELGQLTRYTYDGLNRLTATTLPDTAVIAQTYDAAGNVRTNTLPGNRQWIATYDPAGRLLADFLKSPGGSTTRSFSRTYNAAGRLDQVADGRGLFNSFVYDAWLRPVTNRFTGGTAEQNLTAVSILDNLGRLLVLEETGGAGVTRVERTLDGYGQAQRERVLVDGAVFSDLAQGWDAAGRRSSLGVAFPPLLQGQGAGAAMTFGYRGDGRLTSVTQGGGTLAYGYGDNGLLNSRTTPWRTWTANQRDARGRVQQATTAVPGLGNVLVESLAWRANSTLSSYTADRTGTGTWDETRGYTYNSRGQLTDESFAVWSGGQVYTYHTYDSSRLGVRQGLTADEGAVENGWAAGTPDGFGRLTSENLYIGFWKSAWARGRAAGAQSVGLTLDGVAVPGVRYDAADPQGEWVAQTGFVSGNHSLVATATHPWNGGTGGTNFFARTTNTFTAASPVSISEGYDALGNMTTRTLTGGRTQALAWDGRGRLVRWQETAAGGATNLLWSARYDGLGRRLRVAEARPGAPVAVTESWYDPQVEFLEVAVAYHGRRTWLLHGPDLDGRHGGLQGTGGLEGTVREGDGAATGLVSDHFGHGVARVEGGAVKWSPTVTTGYGPALGFEPAKLSYHVGPAEAAGWRGRRADASGLYWLGARYYDPAAGRFVSPDPLGHAASLSLYDYAGNDPVNGMDPDGRLGKAVARSVWDGMASTWDFVGHGLASASLAEGAMYADMMGDGEMGESLRSASNYSIQRSFQYVDAAINQYHANLQVQDGSYFNALNATLNPLWGAAAGSWESYQGLSLNPYSIGQDLSYNQRIDSAANASLSFFGTVGIAYGFTRPIFCFPAGTHVLMADGSSKPIEDIREGDEVWADDPDDGAPAAPHRVTRLHRNWTLRLIHVAVDSDRDGKADGELKATGEHPFWTANRGWIAAKNLKRDDVLRSAQGAAPVVVAADSVPTTTDTFNLTVEGSHTFFALAGETPVLVHNTDVIPQAGVIGTMGGLPPAGNLLLERHEVLSPRWLEAHGHGMLRAGQSYFDNPAIYVPTDVHRTLITPLQRELGIGPGANWANLTAEDVLARNFAILDHLAPQAGLTDGQIRDLFSRGLDHANLLSNPCP